MRGVILDAELFTGETPQTVHVFLELEEGTLHVRRGYGERSAIVSVPLVDVDAALDALKAERDRRDLLYPAADAEGDA